MSTYWRRPIVCECGHDGCVRQRESEWSGDTWFNLEGFTGGHLEPRDLEKLKGDENILTALSPKCPRCGRTGAAAYSGRWNFPAPTEAADDDVAKPKVDNQEPKVGNRGPES